MTNLILCTGKYAKVPYHFEKIETNLYSVEELCYCIVQNAFLLDTASFDLVLADWLKRECGLDALSERLSDMIRRHASVETLAELILTYVQFETPEEIADVLAILKRGAGLGTCEKKLSRAEYLMENKRYHLAFQEYGEVLKMLPDSDSSQRAQIYHNEGVMYANLFIFGEAEKMFQKAYQIGGSRQSLLCALAARRMGMGEQEYVDYIAKHREVYNDSLLLEQRMKEVTQLYEMGADRHVLHTIDVYKSEGKMAEYYDRVRNIISRIRDEYRNVTVSDTAAFQEHLM